MELVWDKAASPEMPGLDVILTALLPCETETVGSPEQLPSAWEPCLPLWVHQCLQQIQRGRYEIQVPRTLTLAGSCLYLELEASLKELPGARGRSSSCSQENSN